MLMYNILFPEQEVEISPTDNGAAHTNQNIIPNRLYTFNENFNGEHGHPYRYVDPRNLQKPLILYDHEEPNLKEFFDKFPIGKIITIRFNKKMVPLLHGNLFFKNIVHLNEDSEAWIRFRKENSYLSDYNLPKDAPNDIIRKLVKGITKRYLIENYYSDQYIPPEEYSDRIYSIDFYDIIYNKSKVLSQLSEITNRPITDFVNAQYDIYLEKQHELISTNMPWLELT